MLCSFIDNENNQKSQPFFLNPFIPSLWNITRNVSQNSGQSLFLLDNIKHSVLNKLVI